MPCKDAEGIAQKLRDCGVQVSVQDFDPRKSVVQAHLPDKSKKSREHLDAVAQEAGLDARLFLRGKFSGSFDIRNTYPSFHTPLQIREYINHVGHVSWASLHEKEPSLEALLSLLQDETHLYIDIETEGWDVSDGVEEISMVVVGTSSSRHPDLLFTKYDPGKAFISGYQIVPYATQQELGRMLTQYIHDCDPLTIGGYNLIFDLKKLRELTKEGTRETFLPGTDYTAPKVLSASGRTKSVQVHGRFVIDLYNKLSDELTFLPNVKLGTIMQYFQQGFSTTEVFKKDQTYFQLSDTFTRAKHGDITTLPEAIAYTINDGKGTLRLLLDQLEEVFVDAMTLQRRTESVCKGLPHSSDSKWSAEFFKQHKTFRERYTQKYIPRMHPEELQMEYYIDTTECKKNGAFQKAAFFYPTLFLRSCKDIFDAWPPLQAHWEYYEKQGTIKRYRGLRKQMEMMVVPLAEYFDVCQRFDLKSAQPFPEIIPPVTFQNGKVLPFSTVERTFRTTFGNNQAALRDINGRFTGLLDKLYASCQPQDILNYSSRFLLLKPDAANRLRQEKLGIVLAQGPAISAGDKVLFLAHNTVYQLGTKLTRGTNCGWENETILEVTRQALMHLGETGALGSDVLEDMIRHEVEKISSFEKTKLLRKRKNGEHNEYYGFSKGRALERQAFMSALPDARMYEQSFRKTYEETLTILQPKMQTSLF